MPRKTETGPLDAALREFSRQLGEQLATGIEQGLRAAIRGAGHLSPPARPERTRCQVPGCGREAISKGLCQNHYQKARRLKLSLGALTEKQLHDLATDRRALRGRS